MNSPTQFNSKIERRIQQRGMAHSSTTPTRPYQRQYSIGQSRFLPQQRHRSSSLNLYPQSPIQPFTLPEGLPEQISDPEQIEALAETVRAEWNLGLNCIPELIDTLESQGIMVISCTVDSEHKFDGLAGTINAMPLIVVGANWTGDRQRFALAHELGHLLFYWVCLWLSFTNNGRSAVLKPLLIAPINNFIKLLQCYTIVKLFFRERDHHDPSSHQTIRWGNYHQFA